MRLAVFAGAVLSFVICVAAYADAAPDDPFLWLEDVGGARALEWVRGQNEYTLKVLKADPAYEETRAAAQSILLAMDRIPYGNLAGGQVYNFWQDDTHERGLWRRTSLAEYAKPDPQWEVLLDVDALSKAQNENWVWKGAACLPPGYARCLVKLSRGGGDAIVVREFDAASRTFVKGGFEVPEAKTDVAWSDANTIMVATNWGKDTLTKSGYARIIKVVRRGGPLRDAATLFEGEFDDIAVNPLADVEAGGKAERFIVRGVDFFSAELYYVAANWRVIRVPVPVYAEFKGLHKRQLLFLLMKDWRTGGRIFLQGSVVAFSLDDFLASGGALPEVKSLFIPDAKTAVESVTTSRDAVYVSYLDNVKGRLRELTYDGAHWSPRRVALRSNSTR